MTVRLAHHTLVEDAGRGVESVPGVAFPKPGLAGRLRPAWSRPGPGAGARRPPESA